MNGLIGVIMVLFLVTGAAYGIGARTMKSLTDIIKAMEKALSGLGSLIFLFLVISQFVAYFNYSNIGTIMAMKMADVLKTANIGPLWLLIGFIVVVAIIDLLITGAIAKWAIFAPIFVPLLMKLGVASRSRAGCLPRRRFADQFDHAAERLFRVGRRRLPRSTTRTRASGRSWR